MRVRVTFICRHTFNNIHVIRRTITKSPLPLLYAAPHGGGAARERGNCTATAKLGCKIRDWNWLRNFESGLAWLGLVVTLYLYCKLEGWEWDGICFAFRARWVRVDRRLPWQTLTAKRKKAHTEILFPVSHNNNSNQLICGWRA